MRDRVRRACTVIAIGAAMLAPSAASAQAVAVVERKLLPFRIGTLTGVPATFWDGLTFLREQEERQRALKAEINFGLSGDEAGERSLFKLNTGISLSREVFPSELSVVSRLFLQLRDGQLQEDVTSLQITYDYHTGHDVQYFAFAERFTDSFMSIRQRYEVGFGARAGVHAGRVGNWRAIDAHFDNVDAGLPALEAGLPAVRAALRSGPAAQIAGLQDVTSADLAQFRSAVHNLRHSLEDRQARVFVGVVASVFSEIESAEIEVTTVPAGAVSPTAGAVKSKVAVGSEQRYRLSVRPTLRLRPTPQVVITVYPYFKLPIDGPRRATLADGSRRLDYRRDVLSEMSWSVRQEQTGLENVEFVFTLNHYFDNVPPSLSEAVVAETRAAGREFLATSAERSHRVVALALRLRW